MALLVPLAILFPGEIYGYGFTKFLRKVNIRGGSMKFRKNILKIISCSLTIGTGNSAGVEGPIAQVGGALGSLVGKIFRISAERMKVYTNFAIRFLMVVISYSSNIFSSALKTKRNGL